MGQSLDKLLMTNIGNQHLRAYYVVYKTNYEIRIGLNLQRSKVYQQQCLKRSYRCLYIRLALSSQAATVQRPLLPMAQIEAWKI